MSQRDAAPDASQTSKACPHEVVEQCPASSEAEVSSAPTSSDSTPKADQQNEESEGSMVAAIETEATDTGAKAEQENLVVPNVEVRFCIVDGLQVASAHWHEYVVRNCILSGL